VLCIGAHSDDIEIGCGGTVLKLINTVKKSEFYWVVLSADGQRKKEAQESASAFLSEARDRHVVIKNYRDGYFPYIGAEIKDYFETLKHEVQPDVIFTHFRGDLHQDHRLVSELTWNSFRDHLILEYEIPKYDGDLNTPNFFVYLDEDEWKAKIGIILDSFKSQIGNQWCTEDAFRAIMRIRGVESNSPSQHAEAFFCRKQVLG
jgi:LmbE family N-acetylglucosaminyl deacetylase